jgi:hypothetical protein
MSARVQICNSSQIRQDDSIDSWLERHFWRYTTIFLLLFLCYGLMQDLRLKMWYDELFTLYVARQGSPVEIVKAALDGVDATPPLYATIVSFFLPIVRHDAFAVRLASTLGFVAMLGCIVAFCYRRMPAIHAFLAALFAATACGFYATEGRAFGLVLGCAAAALLCWQRAVDKSPRLLAVTLLAVFLMLATALNYYSIFLLFPLGLAEIARWRERGRLDLAVSAAMASALAVLVLHLPFIRASQRFVGHFWSTASWYQIPEFYLKFALIPIAAVLLAWLIRGFSNSPSGPARLVLRRYEWVAITALSLTPIVIIAVSRYTTHVFTFRYALWCVIGIAILAAALIRVISSAQPRVALGFLVVLLAILVGQQAIAFREGTDLREAGALLRQLQSEPDGTEPIVVGYNHAFMELAYYSDPKLRNRIVYPLSQSLDKQYKGFDLDFFNLSALRSRTNLPIVNLDEFLQKNPRFVLAAHSKDYLPSYLQSVGYRLVALNPGQAPSIYEVEAPGFR